MQHLDRHRAPAVARLVDDAGRAAADASAHANAPAGQNSAFQALGGAERLRRARSAQRVVQAGRDAAAAVLVVGIAELGVELTARLAVLERSDGSGVVAQPALRLWPPHAARSRARLVAPNARPPTRFLAAASPGYDPCAGGCTRCRPVRRGCRPARSRSNLPSNEARARPGS